MEHITKTDGSDPAAPDAPRPDAESDFVKVRRAAVKASSEVFQAQVNRINELEAALTEAQRENTELRARIEHMLDEIFPGSAEKARAYREQITPITKTDGR
jgi:predicted RNase H-like nuclease (RuvC/YqgF family)